MILLSLKLHFPNIYPFLIYCKKIQISRTVIFGAEMIKLQGISNWNGVEDIYGAGKIKKCRIQKSWTMLDF